MPLGLCNGAGTFKSLMKAVGGTLMVHTGMPLYDIQQDFRRSHETTGTVFKRVLKADGQQMLLVYI